MNFERFSNHMVHLLAVAVALLSSFKSFSVNAQIAAKKPLVITTTTDLAWAAREILGDAVEVRSLLNGREDPHFVDVRPDYVAQVAQADVVCAVGLDLEVGWLPKVISKAARREIQPGGRGYCDFGSRIQALDKPLQQVDRSQGDVHPQGNPHYWLSPSVLAQASREVIDATERVRPELKGKFEARYSEFKRMMLGLEARLKARLVSANITGEQARFAEYHREFSYFARSFELTSHDTLEEKPGLSPSAGRLGKVATGLRRDKITIVLAARTAPTRVIQKFEEISGLKVGVVSVSVSQAPGSDVETYPQLIEKIIDTLIAVSEKNAAKLR
ncbi:MAG: zinc ABC transporter substrate-binding protein [Betaproteobacteria bacterium]|nr:zinc ABC transporter substrate-binding protein [Betaproteobacteria bacterium]